MVRASELRASCCPTACRRWLPGSSPQSADAEVILASELPPFAAPTAGQGGDSRGADDSGVEAGEFPRAPAQHLMRSHRSQLSMQQRSSVQRSPSVSCVKKQAWMPVKGCGGRALALGEEHFKKDYSYVAKIKLDRTPQISS